MTELIFAYIGAGAVLLLVVIVCAYGLLLVEERYCDEEDE